MKLTKTQKCLLIIGVIVLLYYLCSCIFSHREGMKSQKSSGSVSSDMDKLNKDYKHAMDLLRDGDVDKNALEHSMNLLTDDSKKLYDDLQESDKKQHIGHSSQHHSSSPHHSSHNHSSHNHSSHNHSSSPHHSSQHHSSSPHHSSQHHSSSPHHSSHNHSSSPHHSSHNHSSDTHHINHPSSHSGHHARSDNGYKSKNDFHHPRKHHKISHSKVPGSEMLDSEMSNDDRDNYILKSQIVPPVCPACPQSSACPRDKPCPPCAPCARCPEPSFECKKVPNYNSSAVSNYLPNPMAAQGNMGDPSLASTGMGVGMSGNTNHLPKPVLNDFSKF